MIRVYGESERGTREWIAIHFDAFAIHVVSECAQGKNR